MGFFLGGLGKVVFGVERGFDGGRVTGRKSVESGLVLVVFRVVFSFSFWLWCFRIC